MFAYLSKKIAIPNGVRTRCVAWSLDHDHPENSWLACGCDNGVLKVIRLEGTTNPSAKAAAAGNAAPHNQNLEGHSGGVVCATWNTPYLKLTTSDENGLIIVWVYVDGEWVEEMINNRNKSSVRDMRWTPNGEKICIIYEDGAVIVGSVDGNRLWGKELNLHLSKVEWSADGRFILFATTTGDCHVYDGNGNGVAKVPMYCNDGYTGPCRIIALDWYSGQDGYAEPDCPVLAICLDNGRMQLMRHDMDDNAICIDTGMRPIGMRWNHNGSICAVAGSQQIEGRNVWMVQFFSFSGEHIRTLRIPGSNMGGIAWEGNGLRLALAVDAQLYFASVRYERKWGYFGSTLVYAFLRPERPEDCVMFWDTRSNDRYAKYVRRLISITAGTDRCLLTTQGEAAVEFIIILCNAIGSPVDSKYLSVEPKYVSLTDCCVITSSEEVVYMWQFRKARVGRGPYGGSSSGGGGGGGGWGGTGSSGDSSLNQRFEGKERMVHIDDPGNCQPQDLLQLPSSSTRDPITAVAAHGSTLVVARSSGVVYRYSLPGLILEGQHLLRCRPQYIRLNCDASRMSVIDFNGVLTFFDATAAGTGKMTGEHLTMERKDVWDMYWAEDNPELCAIMEKGRMYVFRGLEPEEPVASTASLAGFGDLEVRAAFMDDIMEQPDTPELDMMVDYDTRSLRDTRALLDTAGFDGAYQFISDNPHPRLWRLLAEAALKRMDWAMAEKAYVHCADYQGIQMVKHLAGLDQPNKQAAEVAVHFKQLEAAEELYHKMDRLDLAVGLRSKLGDWFRVEKLLLESGGSDVEISSTRNKIGQYYSDRQKWAKAAQYYTQARNTVMLLECFYMLEDFQGLVALIEVLPEGDALLLGLGDKLQSVGLCSEAVEAYLKAGDSKRAVDCCVLLHQWDQAMALAQSHNYPQAEQLLLKYVAHLLGKKRYMDAVELYRKAGKHNEAVKLLTDQAQKLTAAKGSPLHIKQLHVLAALEVEAFRKLTLEGAGGDSSTAAATLLNAGRGGSGTTSSMMSGAAAPTAAAQTLAGLVSLEAASSQSGSKVMDEAWHAAEAYHFWLLAHRQLYGGNVEAALRTALTLLAYEDVLDPAELYSFLALVAFYSGFFGLCSKAFVRLESLPDLSQEQQVAYSDLAMNIFLEHPPVDPHSLREATSRDKRAAGGNKGRELLLEEMGEDPDQVCIITGRAVRDNKWLRCKTCRHAMMVAEMEGLKACPLCHSPIPAGLTQGHQGGGRPQHGGSRGGTGASERGAARVLGSEYSSRGNLTSVQE